MRMPGPCVYAVVLGDTEFSAIGHEKRTKESMINGPRHVCLGLFDAWMTGAL
jgi:hypothetical protein